MIALKINNREIKNEELLKEWKMVKETVSKDPTSPTLSDSLTLHYAKENIIQRVILENEAELMIDEVDFKLIQEEYHKLLDHFGGIEKIATLNKDKKPSPHQIKLHIERSLKVYRLLEVWTEDISPPNEAEMLSYYERNQEKFIASQQILFSKFFLPLEPSPQNKILMEELSLYRNKQKDYRDFLEKALQIPHIQYQEKFYLMPGQMDKHIEETLLVLSDEEISGIIQTPEGYYLFKRWSLILPQKFEYDQVREKIEKILFEKKKQKKIREHLSLLKKQTVIEDYFPDPKNDNNNKENK